MRMRKLNIDGLVSVVLLGMALGHGPSLVAQAVQRPDLAPPGAVQVTQQSSSQTLKVSLRTSRPQATPGDSFEIAADIENISSKPLYFNPLYITMIPPPELDPQAPSSLTV